MRLWLSLVVDYELQEIEPLPNLDYKIMQGDSLIEELILGDKNFKLFDPQKIGLQDIQMKNLFEEENQLDIFGEDISIKKIFENYHNWQNKLFNAKSIEQKKRARDKLREFENELIEKTISAEKERLESVDLNIGKYGVKPGIGLTKEDAKKKTDILHTINEIRTVLNNIREAGSRPYFLWQLYFGDVFVENGGFDIVIANPPYGADIDALVDFLRKKYPSSTKNYAEIYKIFIERALRDLSKDCGLVTYITPNTFITQPRYRDLRTYLLENTIVSLINLGEEVFEQVIVPVSISIFRKSHPDKHKYLIADVTNRSKFSGDLETLTFEQVDQSSIKETKDKSLIPEILFKEGRSPLDAFLEIKDGGIQYHRSGIGLKKKGGNDLRFRIFEKSGESRFDNILPVWYGKLVNKFYISPQTDEFFNLDYKDVLKANESVSFSREAFAKKEKLVWRQTASELTVALDKNGLAFRNTLQCAWIRPEYESQLDIRYVLAILNSKYLAYLYNTIVKESGRVFPQIKIGKVKKLPFILAAPQTQKEFADEVEMILEITNKEDYLNNKEDQQKVNLIRSKIDYMVYKLFELTEQEIKVVEEHV